MLRLSLTITAALLSLTAFAPTARAADWVWPLQGEVITAYRNVADPYAGGQHRGIDIAGPVGAPVVAAAGGEVRFAGTAGSSGLTVSLRTADGRFDTSYLHLSSIAVRPGDRVPTGARLGAVGTTGRRSAERPHLHFGVRDAGSRHDYRDPLTLLPAPPVAGPEGQPRGAPAPQPAPPVASPLPAPRTAPRLVPRRVPAGSPRRIPLGSPRHVPERSPRRVPVGSPRRAPEHAPGRVPVGSPGRVPAGSPQRIPVGSPRHVPVASPHGAPVGSPEHVPVSSFLHAHARSPQHASDGSGRDATDGSPRHAHGRLSQPGRAGHTASTHAARSEPSLAQGLAGEAPTNSRSLPVTVRPAPGADRLGQPSHGPDLGWVLACLGLLMAAGILAWNAKGTTRESHTAGRLAALIRPLAGRG
jgi:hypothetical protein